MRQEAGRLLATAAALAAFCAAMGALAGTLGETGGAIWALIAFLLTLLALPFLREEADVFEPVCLFSLLFLLDLARPVYLTVTGEESWVFLKAGLVGDERGLLFAALLLWTVAVVFYFAGYFGSKWVARRLAMRLKVFPDRWPKGRFAKVVLLLLLVGAGSYALLVRSGGGIEGMLSRLYLRREILAGKFYLFWGVLVGQAGLLLLLAWLFSAGRSLLGLPLVVVFTLLLVPLGGRGNIVKFWLCSLGLFHYLRRRLKLWHLGAVGAFAVAFSLLYLSLRLSTGMSQGWRERLPAVAPTPSFWGRLFLLDNTKFDYFAVLLKGMPTEGEFQLGRTWLYLLTNPVPRRIWAEKPPAIEGGIFRRMFFPDEKGGRTISFPGILFLNFSLPGIPLGMFVLGLVHRLFYEYLRRGRFGRGAALPYAVTVVYLNDLSNLAIIGWLLLFLPTAFALHLMAKGEGR